MFSRFNKVLGVLKSFGRPIKSGKQVRKILGSLSTIWQPKVIALECQDLDKISYDELRGDLIAFEKTHLYRQIQEKKKTVSFNATMAEPKNEDEVEGGEQDENIAMLSQVMTNLMRRNKNYSRGSIVGKYKRRKLFGAWSNEEEFDHEEIANMCFMDLSDNEEPDKLALMTYNNEEEDDSRRPYSPLDEGTSEVHTHLCPSCYKLQEFVDIALADIERVVNELRKVKIKREREREKKDCALKLEICEVESDIHQKEVNELRLQLNGTELELRIILEMSTTHLAPTVAKEVTPQIIAGSKTTGGGFGDQNLQIKLKNLTSQDPSRLGYLKISNHVLQEHHKKNRKGKWYLDSACSRHMKGDKQLFKSITKLDGETITFGDKSKGNVISTGKVPLSSTCDVDEVYLVDELGHKDDALGNFEIFCKKVQREKGYYISTIRSDHGREFESRAFEIFCNDQGISHNFSSPRSPQQNGVVERKNRTL
ncbi:uncharacterized protein LOC107759434 [Nicotiana tabacum]|uniref:Uncharacterized protein LOC107759434 n=1 Tax=Nicotiana tabacum TaxID=4097 RepID=A0AC58U2P5_TOBAC